MSESPTEDSTTLLEQVETALCELTCLYKDACLNKEKYKLSVSSFTKRFGISRSIIYTKHPELVSLITQKFKELEQDRLLTEGGKPATPTVASLQQELKRVRRQHKLEIAALATAQLNDFVDKCGPAFREKRQLILEINDLNEKIRLLEITVANQASNIQSLMLRVNAKR